MALSFVWDRRKGDSNLTKHGVGFAEATSVFIDPLARILDDPEHSADERREIIVGRSAAGRLLLISFVEIAPDVVRLISARKATRRERSDYEENAQA